MAAYFREKKKKTNVFSNSNRVNSSGLVNKQEFNVYSCIPVLYINLSNVIMLFILLRCVRDVAHVLRHLHMDEKTTPFSFLCCFVATIIGV